MKVFLGGTCNESKWREKIIPLLMCDYFNPVVEDWTPECQQIEEDEKNLYCDYHLYVITPKMKGVFSIAEVVNDSAKIGDKCIFCVTKEEDDNDFQKHELKSLDATSKLVAKNGATVLTSLEDVVSFLNNRYVETNCLGVKIINKSNYPLPEYKTPLSAGMDLRANIDTQVVLHPMERRLIPTGVFIQLPKGYETQVRPRSGLALKNGITVLNAPGTIDADYTNEIGVILVNFSNEDFTINPGDRIAQLVVAKHEHVVWNEVDKLEETERKGGFGHTGVK
jgi:dUTP pyrophosphatase